MTNVQGRSTKGVMLRSAKGVHRKFGAELLFLARESEVQMEWSVDFIRQNQTTGAKLATVAGTVILHDRWFWVTFALMAASANRGTTLIDPLLTQAYTAGTPEPVDGLHQDGNLTLAGVAVALNFQWRGWTEIDGDGEAKASHIDTGTTIEFYGFINIVGGDPAETIKGVYCRAPNVLEPGGTTDDWIVIYLDGANLEVSNIPPADPVRIIARVKCVVTLPA